MNCVLFAKNGSSFQLKKTNKTLKKYWKMKKNGKFREKVREFCQSGKVGTMHGSLIHLEEIQKITSSSNCYSVIVECCCYVRLITVDNLSAELLPNFVIE